MPGYCTSQVYRPRMDRGRLISFLSCIDSKNFCVTNVIRTVFVVVTDDVVVVVDDDAICKLLYDVFIRFCMTCTL